MSKPHYGRIDRWYKQEFNDPKHKKGLGFQIYGIFLDHPEHKNKFGYTPIVTKFDHNTFDENSIEIGTKQSRYTLVNGSLGALLGELPVKDTVI